ncbi:IclR family transcriptional regulator [Falsiroseomonas sp. HW251]|uniref:IclR family transcriptional regulator n=1 Tax=Falsiroseomonas sp. HW251 TaxID=3390998 RepID=UPI003D320FB1
MPQPAGDAVKSAFRVLDILELLAERPLPLSHAQIGSALGIPKSSLTGLLRTLAARGYVETEAGGHRLGPRVGDLLAGARRRAGAAEAAGPIVARLSAEVGESAGFSVPEGDGARLVAATNARHPLVFVFHVGTRLPLFATSSGKAILAHLPEAELADYLARETWQPLTPRTVRSEKALRKQLAETRRDGLALSFEERHPGIVGIAAPVLDGEGRPLGAVNVALPTARFDAAARTRVGAALRRAAEALARRLVGAEVAHAGGSPRKKASSAAASSAGRSSGT